MPVTLEFLDWVTETVNKPSTVVETYGEAFQVLQFLETAKLVELTMPNAGEYRIQKT